MHWFGVTENGWNERRKTHLYIKKIHCLDYMKNQERSKNAWKYMPNDFLRSWEERSIQLGTFKLKYQNVSSLFFILFNPLICLNKITYENWKDNRRWWKRVRVRERKTRCVFVSEHWSLSVSSKRKFTWMPPTSNKRVQGRSNKTRGILMSFIAAYDMESDQ